MKKIFSVTFFIFILYFFIFTVLELKGQENNELVKNVVIVKNKGEGLWNGRGKRVIFNNTLSIGVQDGSDNEIFYNPLDVIADNDENIYVLDSGNQRIQKFDKSGNYLLTISRKGEGPGEILNSKDIEMDSKNNIIVFDWMGNRISKFSPHGKFLDSFKLTFLPHFGVLDSEDNIYIYGMYKGKLIHKYSSKGEYLFSFMDKIESNRARTTFHVNSSGRIAITKDDNIYLALIYPYTIYVFNKKGILLKKFIADTNYAAAPHITNSNTVIVNFRIIDLNIAPQGYIFCRNTFFKIPDRLDNRKLEEIFSSFYQKYSYIDIFDPNGIFLIHQKSNSFGEGGHFDRKGNYYVIEEGDDCFKAKKYSVQFSEAIKQ